MSTHGRFKSYLLPASAIMLGALLLSGCAGQEPAAATVTVPAPVAPTAPAQAPTLAAQSQATPSVPNCTSPARTTPAMTEGPYWKAGSPERASLLEPGMAGTKLVLTGYVFTTDCKPVANALLDFWQADASGQYDNSGYRLRGHLFSGADGRYQLTTIIPGLYPGRTEHIHVKVQAPNGPVLTTQLFFPDVARNSSDAIFDNRLLVTMQEAGDGQAATYNFVVNSR